MLFHNVHRVPLRMYRQHLVGPSLQRVTEIAAALYLYRILYQGVAAALQAENIPSQRPHYSFTLLNTSNAASTFYAIHRELYPHFSTRSQQ